MITREKPANLSVQEEFERIRELSGDITAAERLRYDRSFAAASRKATGVFNAALRNGTRFSSLTNAADLTVSELRELVEPGFEPVASRALALVAGTEKFHNRHRRAFELLERAILLNPSSARLVSHVHALSSTLNRDLSSEIPNVSNRRQEITRELSFILESAFKVIHRMAPELLEKGGEVVNAPLKAVGSDVFDMLWIASRVALRCGRSHHIDGERIKAFRFFRRASQSSMLMLQLKVCTRSGTANDVLGALSYQTVLAAAKKSDQAVLDAVRVLSSVQLMIGDKDSRHAGMRGFKLLEQITPWNKAFGRIGQHKLIQCRLMRYGNPDLISVNHWNEVREAFNAKDENGVMKYKIAISPGLSRAAIEHLSTLSKDNQVSVINLLAIYGTEWRLLIQAAQIGYGREAQKQYCGDYEGLLEKIETSFEEGRLTPQQFISLCAMSCTPKVGSINPSQIDTTEWAKSIRERASALFNKIDQRHRAEPYDSALGEVVSRSLEVLDLFYSLGGSIINETKPSKNKKDAVFRIMPGYKPMVRR